MQTGYVTIAWRLRRWALSRVALAGLIGATLGTPAAVPAGEIDRTSAPSLESLAWMAGHWRLAGSTRTVEELWLPPAGDLMLGLNRTVSSRGERSQFEYLRLVRTEEGIVLFASPGGRPATPFRLAEAGEHRAVFVNPEHDFPTRIEYRLEGDRLVTAIAGDEPGPSWAFERVGSIEGPTGR